MQCNMIQKKNKKKENRDEKWNKIKERKGKERKGKERGDTNVYYTVKTRFPIAVYIMCFFFSFFCPGKIKILE